MEARLISDNFAKAELLDAAAKSVKPKAAANGILSDISKYLNDKGVELPDTKLTADKLVELVGLIEAGTISGAAGKKVLPAMFETDETVEAIVERMGLKQVSDEGAILAIVQEVIAKNEKAVNDFKADVYKRQICGRIQDRRPFGRARVCGRRICPRRDARRRTGRRGRDRQPQDHQGHSAQAGKRAAAPDRARRGVYEKVRVRCAQRGARAARKAAARQSAQRGRGRCV